jgi:protein-S-isoprenylcysteine O-methyltransferase Ste14
VQTSRSGPVDRSDLLVVAQLAALAGVAWPGRARWALPGAVRAGAGAVLAAGLVLATASGARLGEGLTPRVAPPEDAALRTDGPYAVSRHPLYAGLLAAATGAAVLRRRPEPLVALAALSTVLHVKAGAEERALRTRFGPAYDAYAAGTPRLLPVPTLRSRASRSRR